MEEMLKCKWQTSEEELSEWRCDVYCRKVRHIDCEGKNI